MASGPNDQTQKPFRAPKPVRASLRAIWRGLKRCLYRYPSIYHELWEPQLAIELALPEVLEPVSMVVGGKSLIICDVPSLGSIGDSFRKANDIDSPYAWKWWHERGDGGDFGCFYGDDGAGWADFKRLADSAYLVLRHVKPELPDDFFHGWMAILHQMAHWYPTPLLRSDSMVWRFWECKSDEDHERWVKPEDGGPYPQHPIQYTLEHDVVTSSMAAIELILDDERALLVGRRLLDFPVSYPGREVELPEKLPDADKETAGAIRSESGTDGPVLRFELVGREWHFEFDTGHGIVKRKYLIKGKGFNGFKICRYLLSKPDERQEWKDILRETGQADKLKGVFTKSHQERGDEDSTPLLTEGESRLIEEFEHTHEPGERARLWEQIVAIRKTKQGGNRLFPSGNSTFADQIQAQRDRAIDQIDKVFPELAEYLRERLIRRLCCFIYARDNGLYQILTSDKSQAF